ncbi:SDR family NAD(P)-dependent oxidoreductase [Candidatus Omnitrophota bacterium]
MSLKNKKVLVTGADGFIGSHLVEALLGEGCKVRAFVYYNAFNSRGWLDSLSPKTLKEIDVFSGDIRDPHGVRKAMKDIDVVFHLAALIGIPFSYHSPDSYVDTNIKGTLNVLQSSFECERVLVTSTSEVYGTAKSVPITEDHPLQGQSPYSASKIGADKIAESFFRSFDSPITIVRPFNTYGPRQSARAVIPTMIIQLLSGKKEIRLGRLDPTRDFNYVKDVCNGFLTIAGYPPQEKMDEVNIASGKEVSIGDLAGKIINKINPKAKIVLDKKRVRPEDSEVMRLLGSNKKIADLTGWKPGYTLDKGLDETIKWFKDKKNLRLYKPDEYNV